MPPLIPLRDDPVSPPARRRRARSLLPFVGQEQRDQALDDLAQRAFPQLFFFLFNLLAGFLIGMGGVFSAPVLIIAGLAFAPLLSPLTGAALGIVTASLRFAFRNLAALLLAWFLAFGAAWAAGFLFSPFSSPDPAPALPDPATVVIVVLAAGFLTWRFVRGARDAWMPNLVVSYGCLYPLCLAAGLLAAGDAAGTPPVFLAWGLHAALALAASIVAYLAFGFRPAERDVGAFAGMAAAAAAALGLIILWIGRTPSAAPPAAGTVPVITPAVSPAFTPPPSPTPTPSDSPAPSETPAPSVTLTPTMQPVSAVITGTGGQGVYLRDAPGLGGKKIDSLAEGDTVEVLGPAVEADGTWWIPVRTASGVTGWMALEFCATATPISTP
jgi:hypothetical protein